MKGCRAGPQENVFDLVFPETGTVMRRHADKLIHVENRDPAPVDVRRGGEPGQKLIL